jgi:hypothetical protein
MAKTLCRILCVPNKKFSSEGRKISYHHMTHTYREKNAQVASSNSKVAIISLPQAWFGRDGCNVILGVQTSTGPEMMGMIRSARDHHGILQIVRLPSQTVCDHETW